MLDREIAYYDYLNKLGVSTTFITYGSKKDLELLQKIYPISICCNKWGLQRRLYELLIPILFYKTLKSSELIKSNQLFGGEFAIRAGKIFKKPVVIRNGWLVSKTLELNDNQTKLLNKIKNIEKMIFSHAKSIIVTTSLIKREIIQRYSIDKMKVNIIPNYINTKLFKPISMTKEYDAIYVGRLEEEKNPEIFLNAISEIGLKVLIIGKGKLKSRLMEQFAYLGENIDWIDSVPNNELPKYYNKSKMYIIPSKYENNPKTLLEAMACGLPVIGANVMGIRNIINNKINGLLYDGTIGGLINNVNQLITDSKLKEEITKNARKFIKRCYDIKNIANEEYNLLEKLIT